MVGRKLTPAKEFIFRLVAWTLSGVEYVYKVADVTTKALREKIGFAYESV